ncbi:MAG: acyltransferase [Alphaproteobacteria bacterium]|nr:acyltransferase [Alphaproteobacteria bacterium]
MSDRPDALAAREQGNGPRDPDLHGHLPALDGLRALAVTAVIVHHGLQLVVPVDAASRLLVAAGHLGWMGVDLFFVLSGFLITGILVDVRGSPSYFRAFYLRRVVRIFPLYYAALAAWSALVVLRSGAAGLDPDLAGLWLYASNYVLVWRDAWGSRPVAHFWSLAVEEQFYLFWPALVALVAPARLRGVLGALVVLTLAGRLVQLSAGGSPLSVYVATHSRLDTLVVGALLAVVGREVGGLRALRPLAGWGGAAALGAVAAGVLASGTVVWEAWPVWFLGTVFTGIALTSAAAVVLAVTAPPTGALARLLDSPALVSLGKHSYAIYVVHLPIDHVVRGLGLHPAAWASGVALAPALVAYLGVLVGLSWAVAKVTWVAIEAPALRLKGRAPYLPAPAPPPTS